MVKETNQEQNPQEDNAAYEKKVNGFYNLVGQMENKVGGEGYTSEQFREMLDTDIDGVYDGLTKYYGNKDGFPSKEEFISKLGKKKALAEGGLDESLLDGSFVENAPANVPENNQEDAINQIALGGSEEEAPKGSGQPVIESNTQNVAQETPVTQSDAQPNTDAEMLAASKSQIMETEKIEKIKFDKKEAEKLAIKEAKIEEIKADKGERVRSAMSRNDVITEAVISAKEKTRETVQKNKYQDEELIQKIYQENYEAAMADPKVKAELDKIYKSVNSQLKKKEDKVYDDYLGYTDLKHIDSKIKSTDGEISKLEKFLDENSGHGKWETPQVREAKEKLRMLENDKVLLVEERGVTSTHIADKQAAELYSTTINGQTYTQSQAIEYIGSEEGRDYITKQSEKEGQRLEALALAEYNNKKYGTQIPEKLKQPLNVDLGAIKTNDPYVQKVLNKQSVGSYSDGTVKRVLHTTADIGVGLVTMGPAIQETTVRELAKAFQYVGADGMSQGFLQQADQLLDGQMEFRNTALVKEIHKATESKMIRNNNAIDFLENGDYLKATGEIMGMAAESLPYTGLAAINPGLIYGAVKANKRAEYAEIAGYDIEKGVLASDLSDEAKLKGTRLSDVTALTETLSEEIKVKFANKMLGNFIETMSRVSTKSASRGASALVIDSFRKNAAKEMAAYAVGFFESEIGEGVAGATESITDQIMRGEDVDMSKVIESAGLEMLATLPMTLMGLPGSLAKIGLYNTNDNQSRMEQNRLIIQQLEKDFPGMSDTQKASAIKLMNDVLVENEAISKDSENMLNRAKPEQTNQLVDLQRQIQEIDRSETVFSTILASKDGKAALKAKKQALQDKKNKILKDIGGQLVYRNISNPVVHTAQSAALDATDGAFGKGVYVSNDASVVNGNVKSIDVSSMQVLDTDKTTIGEAKTELKERAESVNLTDSQKITFDALISSQNGKTITKAIEDSKPKSNEVVETKTDEVSDQAVEETTSPASISEVFSALGFDGMSIGNETVIFKAESIKEANISKGNDFVLNEKEPTSSKELTNDLLGQLSVAFSDGNITEKQFKSGKQAVGRVHLKVGQVDQVTDQVLRDNNATSSFNEVMSLLGYNKKDDNKAEVSESKLDDVLEELLETLKSSDYLKKLEGYRKTANEVENALKSLIPNIQIKVAKDSASYATMMEKATGRKGVGLNTAGVFIHGKGGSQNTILLHGEKMESDSVIYHEALHAVLKAFVSKSSEAQGVGAQELVNRVETASDRLLEEIEAMFRATGNKAGLEFLAERKEHFIKALYSNQSSANVHSEEALAELAAKLATDLSFRENMSVAEHETFVDLIMKFINKISKFAFGKEVFTKYNTTHEAATFFLNVANAFANKDAAALASLTLPPQLIHKNNKLAAMPLDARQAVEKANQNQIFIDSNVHITESKASSNVVTEAGKANMLVSAGMSVQDVKDMLLKDGYSKEFVEEVMTEARKQANVIKAEIDGGLTKEEAHKQAFEEFLSSNSKAVRKAIKKVKKDFEAKIKEALREQRVKNEAELALFRENRDKSLAKVEARVKEAKQKSKDFNEVKKDIGADLLAEIRADKTLQYTGTELSSAVNSLIDSTTELKYINAVDRILNIVTRAKERATKARAKELAQKAKAEEKAIRAREFKGLKAKAYESLMEELKGIAKFNIYNNSAFKAALSGIKDVKTEKSLDKYLEKINKIISKASNETWIRSIESAKNKIGKKFWKKTGANSRLNDAFKRILGIHAAFVPVKLRPAYENILAHMKSKSLDPTTLAHNIEMIVNEIDSSFKRIEKIKSVVYDYMANSENSKGKSSEEIIRDAIQDYLDNSNDVFLRFDDIEFAIKNKDQVINEREVAEELTEEQQEELEELEKGKYIDKLIDLFDYLPDSLVNTNDVNELLNPENLSYEEVKAMFDKYQTKQALFISSKVRASIIKNEASAELVKQVLSLVNKEAVLNMPESDRALLIAALTGAARGYVNQLFGKVHIKLNAAFTVKKVDIKNKKAAGRFNPMAWVKAALLSKKGSRVTKTEAILGAAPNYHIDAFLGNFKNSNIYRYMFRPLAEQYSSYEIDVESVLGTLAKAEEGLSNNSLTQYKQKVRMMIYMLQKEFQTNPGNSEVKPAREFIDATILDQGIGAYSQRSKEIIKEIANEMLSDGINTPYTKMNMSKAELGVVKAIAKVNEFLEDKAMFAETVIRGNSYSSIKNHISVSARASRRQAVESVEERKAARQKTTRAGTLKKRTQKASSISFDPLLSTLNAARQTLLDYHLTQEFKKTDEAVKRVIAITEDGSSQHEAALAIKTSLDRVESQMIPQMANEGTVAASQFIIRQTYRTMLSGMVRSVTEGVLNLGYGIIADPSAMKSGTAVIASQGLTGNYQAIRDFIARTKTTQKPRMLSGGTRTALDSKDIERGLVAKGEIEQQGDAPTDVGAAMKQIFDATGLKWIESVNEINDGIIMKPDQILAMVSFVGKFANEFKKKTGETINIEKFNNDEKYRDRHRAAIQEAEFKADQLIQNAISSNNPADGVPDNQKPASNDLLKLMFQTFNNFMSTFRRGESSTLKKALNNLVRSNTEMSKVQALQYIGATTFRMVSYHKARMALMGLGFLAAGKVLGYQLDEDEDDRDDVYDKLTDEKAWLRASIDTAITLLFVGQRGNLFGILTNFGVETMNKKFGEGITRDKGTAYARFDNSVSYDIIGTALEAQDAMWEAVSNGTGGYQSSAKILGVGFEWYKAYLSYRKKHHTLMKTPEKSKEDKDNAYKEMRLAKLMLETREFSFYLDFVTALGLVPDARDAKKVANAYLWARYNHEKIPWIGAEKYEKEITAKGVDVKSVFEDGKNKDIRKDVIDGK